MHNEYTHKTASKGSSPNVLHHSSEIVHFEISCTLGVMLHGINIGTERSMTTLTPIPSHYHYLHAQI